MTILTIKILSTINSLKKKLFRQNTNNNNNNNNFIINLILFNFENIWSNN